MRNLYLIRHGTPDFPMGIKQCIGRTEIDIGKEGIEEAKKLANFFREKRIEAIYSSPLTRCIHTAEILSEGKKEILIHDDLAEIYMGHWEGVPLKNIKKNLGDEPIYGEKRVDALVRFEGALKDIMEKTSGDVICVAHAGVNCAFIAKTRGEDIKISRAIKQPCASYNRFEYDGKKFIAKEIGCIPKE